MMNHLSGVNNPGAAPEERLECLNALRKNGAVRVLPPAGPFTGEVNNHIHTIYSFSPYTPAMAALRSREAGLVAAGSVDHDSIAAAQEMIAACALLGMGGCVGFEVRVSFKTGADGKPGPFRDRKINNPDSPGIAYMTVQGMPQPSWERASAFLAPIRAERLIRTRNMAALANDLLAEAHIPPFDFEADITASSQFSRGGEITERHLLAALGEALIRALGRGNALVQGLGDRFGLYPPEKIAALLADPDNPYYLYDLLGVLKSGLLPRIFIQPGERECPPAERATEFARSLGAIPAYAYLGDVGDSPTGDKKAERFEDAYLEELFEELARRGFQALAYMPPRNTAAQLRRIRRLCGEWGFMEISGVDVNSPRQSFNCPEVLGEEFRHRLNTTWALVAHERLSSVDRRFGLFSAESPWAGRDRGERLAIYAEMGKSLDLRRPEESAQDMAAAIGQ